MVLRATVGGLQGIMLVEHNRRQGEASSSRESAQMSVVEDIFAVFERQGAAAYFGEPVSVTEHCLQAARITAPFGPQP